MHSTIRDFLQLISDCQLIKNLQQYRCFILLIFIFSMFLLLYSYIVPSDTSVKSTIREEMNADQNSPPSTANMFS